jgi:hypothetical protein
MQGRLHKTVLGEGKQATWASLGFGRPVKVRLGYAKLEQVRLLKPKSSTDRASI